MATLKQHMNPQTRERYRLVKTLLGDLSTKVVLDVGSGTYPISRGLKTKKTITVDGIKEKKPTICCDITKGIPLPDKSVDVIIAGEFLEHLFNPFTFLRECNRLLRKEGFIVVSTPNICSLKNRLRVILGMLPEYCAEPLDNDSYERHVIDYNLKRLSQMFEDCGFRVVKATSNGIVTHSHIIWPSYLTPATFGETLVIRAVKK